MGGASKDVELSWGWVGAIGKAPRSVVTATASLAVTSAVLGAVGVTDLLARHGDPSPLNVAYGVLALFLVNGGFHTSADLPVALQIAQLTAPASTALAAIVALHARFRERVLRREAARLSGHVVVLGAGHAGLQVLRSLSSVASVTDAADRVVVIDPQPGDEVRSLCRAQSWAVLTGDGADESVRTRGAVASASDVFVATGNDARDLEVVRSIGLSSTAGTSTHVHVRLDSGLLARELMKGAFSAAGSDGCIVDYVDRHGYEVMAVQEVLLDRLAAKFTTGLADRVADRATFIGQSRLAESASGLMARSLAARSQLQLPWIVEAVEQVDSLPATLSDGQRLVYVSCGEASETLTVALTAARRRDVRAVVALIDSGGPPRWLDDREMVLLVDGDQLLHSPGALRHGYIELMAQLIHADYIANERRRGTLSATKATHRPWAELSHAAQEQNRSQAAFFLSTLPATGRRLDEVGTGSPAPYSQDEVETFAAAEHDRWARMQYDRAHPSLVPWVQLTDDDKDRDRETIARRPALAALLGLEIVWDEASTAA